MLIFDLDDTIFRTSSMNPQIFDTAISIVRNHYETVATQIAVDKLMHDMWSNPIDVVFAQYQTPQQVVTQFYEAIANIGK